MGKEKEKKVTYRCHACNKAFEEKDMAGPDHNKSHVVCMKCCKKVTEQPDSVD